MNGWPHAAIAPLASISPSRFSAMNECRLREVFSASNEAPPLPRSPRAILGTIVHKLLENASKGRIEPGKVEAELASLIEEAQGAIADGSPDSQWLPLETQPGFRQMMRRASESAAAEVAAAPPHGGRGTGPRRAGSELWVKARSDKVRGRIDMVRSTPTGIVLEDFKTGPLVERREPDAPPRASYSDQLKLYAAMYAEDPNAGEGVWPTALELVSLSGTRLPVPFSVAECVELLDAAERVLGEVNDLIADAAAAELAAPSPEACRYCTFRPACGPYRQAREQAPDHEEGWPSDDWGAVVDVAQIGNATTSLTISGREDVVRVRGLVAERHPVLCELHEGTEMAFFSAIPQRGTNTVAEGRFTTLFRL